MDRFVTRAPTWKTVSYGSVVAQANNRSANSKYPSSASQQLKKPLQQKQLGENGIKPSQDFAGRLVDIFKPSTANHETLNINGNSNDSGLSSASSISPPQHQMEENMSNVVHMKTPTKNKCLGKLGDYVDGREEKENDTYMTLNRTPKSTKKAIESCKVAAGLKENTPSKQLPQTPKVNKPITTTKTNTEKVTPSNNPMLMARIQRDLNSPSASVRVRALKAITSPTKSPYTHFDVPEAEQSLNFSAVQDPPDIKEVMRNVVVYVEVRSGEDNRSDGVRKVIEALGARVNLKLLRDTTHVVFKDGLMSTFKKAQQWGIPIVSILWIEACKTKNRICDPKDYPISNLDRYENPELYTKMKRYKCMQPDSESSISRKGGSAQRDLTPTQKTAAGANKKNSTMIGGTPTGRSSAKKKTDISQYFKKLDNSVMTTPITSVLTKKADSQVARAESPATQLLNRINANIYTPLMQAKTTTISKQITITTSATIRNVECFDEESRESTVASTNGDILKTQKVKKALDFFESSPDVPTGDAIDNTTTGVLPTPRTRRRSSILAVTNNNNETTLASEDVATATPSKITRRRSITTAATIAAVDQESQSSAVANLMKTPNGKNPRRRTTIHTPKNMTMETPSKNKPIQPITEEEEGHSEEVPNSSIDSSAVKARRTLHVSKTMEVSERTISSSNNAIKENQPKSNRRRTINSYAPKNNHTSPPNNSGRLDLSNVATRRPTCYSVKSMETSSIQCDNNSKEEIGGKLEKTIELTNQIFNALMNKNAPTEKAAVNTSKANVTNRRRTLYTPKKVSDSTFPQSRPSESLSSISPMASNMHGKVVACSTLLESAENPPTKLMETPPANSTTGKLLEETTECATPLIFSSTRLPGNKRRTLFDVSMDIITQRLQCINQTARRSLAPATTADLNGDVKSCDIPSSEIVDIRKGGGIAVSTDGENSSNSQRSSTESDNQNISISSTTENIDSGSTPTVNKKRKLFVPNEVLTPPPVLTATSKLNTSINSTPSIQRTLATAASEQKKRRRTLLPLTQTIISSSSSTSDLLSADSSPPAMLKRRSTLDFEQIKKYQNKLSRKNQDADASNDGGKSKKTPGLVYTNMHSEQIDVIKEVVNKLSVFNLEQHVTDNTTHLVSLEPRRTMNLLRAISRGLWVVDYNWILDSQKAGEWLAEEPYELKDFSRAVEICRSERQAFGERYKCELFRELGAFYISLRCYPVTKNDLCELITLCGGRVALSRNKARYIIGDTNPSLPDKIYVTPYWVLDSISQMQIMKIQKYLCPKPGEEMPLPTSPVVVQAAAQIET